MEKVDSSKKGTGFLLKAGYAGLFVVVYVVAFYYLLPYDKITRYLEVTLSETTKCNVKIDSVEFNPLSGVTLNNIHFEKKLKGETRSLLDIDELKISSFLYSAVMFPKSKEMSMTISSKLYGGSVNGSIHLAQDKAVRLSSIDLTINGIDISKLTLADTIFNVKAKGALDGEISLASATGELMKATGKVDLTISDGAVTGIVLNNIGSGMLRLDNMKLPDIKLGAVKVSLNKDPQRPLKVKTISVKGGDMNADFSGNVNLSRNIRATSANLIVKFNFADSFLKKDVTLSMLDQSLKSFKDVKGFYNIKLDGSLMSPKIRTM